VDPETEDQDGQPKGALFVASVMAIAREVRKGIETLAILALIAFIVWLWHGGH